jgi:5-formyltetrahydrofolate cyclo-ligase
MAARNLLKTTVRPVLRAKRAEFAEEYAESHDFQAKLRDSTVPAILALLPSNNLIIAGYFPLHTEFDCRYLLLELQAAGYKIALPVIKERFRPLIFREWDGDDTHLLTGEFGAKIPPETAKIVRPDVLLVPLLGFNDQRYRLGYGGGYYDITIEQMLPNIITIGVAYSV